MTTKIERRIKIKYRVRNKVSGTAACPRMSVFRSNKQIYVQVIDDLSGKTLAAASSLGLTEKLPKKEMAAKVGEMIAKKYCGSLNYKGAEAEYLGKLESMRQDMQQLEQVPEKELKKKLKKKQKFVIKLLILLAALAAILAVIVFRVRYIEPRDARADYLWEKENFPILDRLYQEKDLEALMDFYEQAVEENRTIDRWEHSGIFRWLMSCRDAREYLALEQSGETLNEYQQALLLDDYWMMRGLDYSEVILTEKDREYIRPYVEATLNSLADRYTFTAEEEKKFEDSLRNNYGYPRYEDCEEYIKKHNE